MLIIHHLAIWVGIFEFFYILGIQTGIEAFEYFYVRQIQEGFYPLDARVGAFQGIQTVVGSQWLEVFYPRSVDLYLFQVFKSRKRINIRHRVVVNVQNPQRF